MERAHIQGMLDIYKVLKQNAALIMNHRYGPDYLLPSQTLRGQLFRLGLTSTSEAAEWDLLTQASLRPLVHRTSSRRARVPLMYPCFQNR